MAEVEQQPETELPRPKKRRIMRSVLFTLLIVLVLLVASFAVMFTTDKGSKFLLDRVLQSQKIIHYEYEGGNLLHGIILKNIALISVFLPAYFCAIFSLDKWWGVCYNRNSARADCARVAQTVN